MVSFPWHIPIAFRHRPKTAPGVNRPGTVEYRTERSDGGYAAKALDERGMARTITRAKGNEVAPRPLAAIHIEGVSPVAPVGTSG